MASSVGTGATWALQSTYEAARDLTYGEPADEPPHTSVVAAEAALVAAIQRRLSNAAATTAAPGAAGDGFWRAVAPPSERTPSPPPLILPVCVETVPLLPSAEAVQTPARDRSASLGYPAGDLQVAAGMSPYEVTSRHRQQPFHTVAGLPRATTPDAFQRGRSTGQHVFARDDQPPPHSPPALLSRLNPQHQCSSAASLAAAAAAAAAARAPHCVAAETAATRGTAATVAATSSAERSVLTADEDAAGACRSVTLPMHPHFPADAPSPLGARTQPLPQRRPRPQRVTLPLYLTAQDADFDSHGGFLNSHGGFLNSASGSYLAFCAGAAAAFGGGEGETRLSPNVASSMRLTAGCETASIGAAMTDMAALTAAQWSSHSTSGDQSYETEESLVDEEFHNEESALAAEVISALPPARLMQIVQQPQGGAPSRAQTRGVIPEEGEGDEGGKAAHGEESGEGEEEHLAAYQRSFDEGPSGRRPGITGRANIPSGTGGGVDGSGMSWGGAVGRYGTLLMSSAGWRCTELYDMHDSLLLSKLAAERRAEGVASPASQKPRSSLDSSQHWNLSRGEFAARATGPVSRQGASPLDDVSGHGPLGRFRSPGSACASPLFKPAGSPSYPHTTANSPCSPATAAAATPTAVAAAATTPTDAQRQPQQRQHSLRSQLQRLHARLPSGHHAKASPGAMPQPAVPPPRRGPGSCTSQLAGAGAAAAAGGGGSPGSRLLAVMFQGPCAWGGLKRSGSERYAGKPSGAAAINASAAAATVAASAAAAAPVVADVGTSSDPHLSGHAPSPLPRPPPPPLPPPPPPPQQPSVLPPAARTAHGVNWGATLEALREQVTPRPSYYAAPGASSSAAASAMVERSTKGHKPQLLKRWAAALDATSTGSGESKQLVSPFAAAPTLTRPDRPHSVGPVFAAATAPGTAPASPICRGPVSTGLPALPPLAPLRTSLGSRPTSHFSSAAKHPNGTPAVWPLGPTRGSEEDAGAGAGVVLGWGGSNGSRCSVHIEPRGGAQLSPSLGGGAAGTYSQEGAWECRSGGAFEVAAGSGANGQAAAAAAAFALDDSQPTSLPGSHMWQASLQLGSMQEGYLAPGLGSEGSALLRGASAGRGSAGKRLGPGVSGTDAGDVSGASPGALMAGGCDDGGGRGTSEADDGEGEGEREEKGDRGAGASGGDELPSFGVEEHGIDDERSCSEVRSGTLELEIDECMATAPPPASAAAAVAVAALGALAGTSTGVSSLPPLAVTDDAVSSETPRFFRSPAAAGTAHRAADAAREAFIAGACALDDMPAPTLTPAEFAAAAGAISPMLWATQGDGLSAIADTPVADPSTKTAAGDFAPAPAVGGDGCVAVIEAEAVPGPHSDAGCPIAPSVLQRPSGNRQLSVCRLLMQEPAGQGRPERTEEERTAAAVGGRVYDAPVKDEFAAAGPDDAPPLNGPQGDHHTSSSLPTAAVPGNTAGPPRDVCAAGVRDDGGLYGCRRECSGCLAGDGGINMRERVVVEVNSKGVDECGASPAGRLLGRGSGSDGRLLPPPHGSTFAARPASEANTSSTWHGTATVATDGRRGSTLTTRASSGVTGGPIAPTTIDSCFAVQTPAVCTSGAITSVAVADALPVAGGAAGSRSRTRSRQPRLLALLRSLFLGPCGGSGGSGFVGDGGGGGRGYDRQGPSDRQRDSSNRWRLSTSRSGSVVRSGFGGSIDSGVWETETDEGKGEAAVATWGPGVAPAGAAGEEERCVSPLWASPDLTSGGHLAHPGGAGGTGAAGRMERLTNGDEAGTATVAFPKTPSPHSHPLQLRTHSHHCSGSSPPPTPRKHRHRASSKLRPGATAPPPPARPSLQEDSSVRQERLTRIAPLAAAVFES